MTAEDFKVIMQKIEAETDSNVFAKMVIDLSKEVADSEQFIDVDKCLDVIQKASLFEDPQLISGFLQGNTYNMRNLIINRSYASTNFI